LRLVTAANSISRL